LQDEEDAQEEGEALDGEESPDEEAPLEETRSRDKIFETVGTSVIGLAVGAALTFASASAFDLALTLLVALLLALFSSFVDFFDGALFFLRVASLEAFEAVLVFASAFRGVRDFSLTTAAVSARKGLLV
jgi:hypothetical protein